MPVKHYLSYVRAVPEPPIFPAPLFARQEDLVTALRVRGLDLKLGEALKGGVASQVYAATLEGKPVVVKHTEHLLPGDDPTDHWIHRDIQQVDALILQKLQGSPVKVPAVLQHFPDITTTVMEDMRESGFGLLSQQILDRKLNPKAAEHIGKSLAKLAQELRKIQQLEPFDTAEENIFERGLELRLVYPNEQAEYTALEQEYLGHNQYVLWPDGHPKNMLVNPAGEVTFIDFGRSHYGDQRYMLPNFLAHIVLFHLGGYIEIKETVEFVQSCVQSYQTLEEINEGLFCQYLGMELLHRGFGKWISGIETKEQKGKALTFGLSIFDHKIARVDQLIRFLEKV
jgi:thiamine kinase-like enzyme